MIPAILILLIHGLIWHEHGQYGLVIPSFQNTGQADITLLESLLSADTGEEHLEVYFASDTLEGIIVENGDQADHFFLIQFALPFTRFPELHTNHSFPPRDLSPPESRGDTNYLRGPPARV